MEEGHIALVRFPHTDLNVGKLRPVLHLRKLPGVYNDWLICMISSKLLHHTSEFDEIMRKDDAGFKETGLKVSSVVRCGRLAVVDESVLLGAVGKLSLVRLIAIRQRIARWLTA